jgi:hypothetical protein
MSIRNALAIVSAMTAADASRPLRVDQNADAEQDHAERQPRDRVGVLFCADGRPAAQRSQ